MIDPQPSLVSVIIPSYNHGGYIEEAIRSVWNQTYPRIELIVLDDGSQDTSKEVISRLELESPIPMTTVIKENEGLCKTLNRGLALAKGVYVSILASDDLYHEEKTQKQVEFMEAHLDCQLCYGRIYTMHEHGIHEGGELPSLNGQAFDQLLCGSFIPAVTCFLRKDILKKLGGFDETSYIEDWDMWLRIAHSHEIGYVDDFLAYYRKHDHNMSSNLDEMESAKLAILNKWKGSDAYGKAIRAWRLSYYTRLLEAERGKEALKMLKYFWHLVYRKGFWVSNFRYLKRFLLTPN